MHKKHLPTKGLRNWPHKSPMTIPLNTLATGHMENLLAEEWPEIFSLQDSFREQGK